MEIEDVWENLASRVQREFGDEFAKAFGFDELERDVIEMVSPHNHRSFPADLRWHCDEDIVFRRAGLTVFDFKRSAWEQVPSGRIVLERKAAGYVVRMTCDVERAFRNSRAVVGQTIVPGMGRPITSRNCGRCVLSFVDISFTPTGTKRRRPRESD